MSDTTNRAEDANDRVNKPEAAPTKPPAIQPLLLFSGVLTAVAGLLSLVALSSLPAAFEWALDGGADLIIRPWAYILGDLLAPVLSFGAAYFALVKRDSRKHVTAVVAAYLVPGAMYAIVELIRFLFVPQMWSGPGDILYLLRNFVPFVYGNQTLEHDFRLILFIINIVVAWIVVLVIKNSNSIKSVTNQFGGTSNMINQQPIGYDPHTGAPIYGQAGYMRPESPLPLVALIGGILFPLLGIIAGHIALGQMKRGEIPSTNMSLAKTGLVLGYVFMAFGIIAVAIYAAIMVAVASSIYY